MEIIDLEKFKQHARIDYSDEDFAIDTIITAANAYVSGLVGADLESDTPYEPPADVVEATLLIASTWWENRENAVEAALSDVPLNASAILVNHRLWAF